MLQACLCDAGGQEHDKEGHSMAYTIVSADSHLEISIEQWIHHVPEEHRDRAPRRIRLSNGGDAWLVEGRPLHVLGLEMCGGRPYEEFEPTGTTYEGSAGTGGPEQRVAEQDIDGVDAEVLFPGISGPSIWRGIANDDAYRAVVRAYNRYLVEDYVSYDPGRLLGLGVIPETGLEDALAELRFCARHKLRGVCLNAWPSGNTYPVDADDAFWREAIDLGMAITVHVALRYMGGATRGTSLKYAKPTPADMSVVGIDPLRRICTW